MTSPKQDYETAVDLFVLKKYDEAADAFKKIITKEPTYFDAYESLGMIYYKLNRLDEAIEWTKKLVALDPNHAMAHTNLSVFYMKKGLKDLAEEEKAKATVLKFGQK